MIKFYTLFDAPTGTLNYYQCDINEYRNARLFLIDINKLTKRAYCFVVNDDDVYYFLADIWAHESVEYLYWYNRYTDKIVEYRANQRKSASVFDVTKY